MTFLLLGAALVACQDGGSLTNPAELEAPPPLLAKAPSPDGISVLKGGKGSTPGKVADLAVSSVTSLSATLTFTEVDDSKGEPASYVLKYSAPPLDWKSASPAQGTCAGVVDGSGVGSERTCVVSGLQAGTKYQFQLAAVRLGGGNSGRFVTLSNIASGTTEPESEGHAEPPAEEPADSTNTGDVSDPQPTPSDTSTVDSGSSDSTSAGSDSTSSGSDSTSSGTGSGSTETSEPAAPGDVKDLAVTGTGEEWVQLSFSEVDDGDGEPAKYDIRYQKGQMDWGSAESVANGTCATVLKGKAIGNKHKCQVDNLDPGSSYEFQLVAFRGTLNQDAVFGELSNVDSGSTDAVSEPAPAAPEQEAPSGSSGGGGPNEPAGFATLVDFDYSTNPQTKPGAELQQDPNAPKSSPSFLRATLPEGYEAGSWEPGLHTFEFAEQRELYVAGWYRLPAANGGWENQSVGTKMLYLLHGHRETGAASTLFWKGNNTQDITTNEPIYLSAAYFVDDTKTREGLPDPHNWGIPGWYGNGSWTVGNWHLIETYYKLNEPETEFNGVFKMWIDGKPVITITKSRYSSPTNNAGFYAVKHAWIWGGIGGTKTRDDYIDVDHIYVSGLAK